MKTYYQLHRKDTTIYKISDDELNHHILAGFFIFPNEIKYT